MITLKKLERTLHIRQTIEKLQEELHSIYSSVVEVVSPAPDKKKGRKKKGKVARVKSKAKAAISSAVNPPAKKKKTMSAAGKAKIAAAQKARWAKLKAAKG